MELTDEQAQVLSGLLDGVLGELSSEIADTDNARYRASLNRRRQSLRDIRRMLDTVEPAAS